METTLPEMAIAPNIGVTIQEMVLNADPIVKGVMLLLVLASVICWAIILEKAIRIALFNGQVRRFERFAETLAEAPGRASWFAAALMSAAQRQDFAAEESRAEREARLEKAMRLAARQEISRMQPRMRFLATVGSTAPFIGLFGTVWGIMNSFTAIAAQKDTSLAVVAPGIAEALFATALGLVAAIPAVIAYNQITGAFSRSGERVTFAISLLAENLLRRTPAAR
jgi:biopolymer transport protein ExbB/TolQ